MKNNPKNSMRRKPVMRKSKALENRTRIQDAKPISELSRSHNDDPAMRIPCSERKVAKLAMCVTHASGGICSALCNSRKPGPLGGSVPDTTGLDRDPAFVSYTETSKPFYHKFLKKKMLRYEYTHKDGQIFICVAPDLKAAHRRRDIWLGIINRSTHTQRG